MFKELMRMYINHLKWVVNELERAYEETYTEVSKKLNKNIELRKKRNKQKFIEEAGEFLERQMLKEKNIKVNEHAKRFFGEHMFKIAELRGDLDEFNNFKYEEER